MTYYAIYDLQCERYMCSGYNTTTLKAAQNEIVDYFANDTDTQEACKCSSKKKTIKILKSIPLKTLLKMEEMELHENPEPFDEI